VPFGIMIVVSFFRRIEGSFYEPAFVLDNYARFLSVFFGGVLGFSLFLAALVAAICVAIGLPFTYLLTRLPQRLQVGWLVGLLAILSLSEVIIGFAWSTLFSRTAGITNIFAELGAMSEPVSLSPSFAAVLTGMVYQALPYTILVLFAPVARLEPSLVEAARTLGASPVQAFFNLVLPTLRNAVLATLILVFVFALGSYLLPQILGRPPQWTLSVLITDQAIYQSNLPFAAAMAVFLVLVSLALVGLSLLLGRRETA
jgi:putative spermidine/putrescine transport system permease protein